MSRYEHQRGARSSFHHEPGYSLTASLFRPDTGEEFELVLDDALRITDVSGPWPGEDGAEFELRGELPAHAPVADVPAQILEFAATRGGDVCMYDPIGCRTCFCDESGRVLYCKNIC